MKLAIDDNVGELWNEVKGLKRTRGKRRAKSGLQWELRSEGRRAGRQMGTGCGSTDPPSERRVLRPGGKGEWKVGLRFEKVQSKAKPAAG